MPPDSPEVCAGRRALLEQELIAYREVPADRRQVAPRPSRRTARRPANAGVRSGPRPAPVPAPPDAVLEIRVVGNRLAVRSDRRDAVVRSRTELVAAVLEAVGSRSTVKTRP